LPKFQAIKVKQLYSPTNIKNIAKNETTKIVQSRGQKSFH
jgi:hypothetical protein